MHLINSFVLFSLLTLSLGDDHEETMEEFYCSPMWEQYPLTRNGWEILRSEPRLYICPKDCGVSKTEEVWTKFEVRENGEVKTKKAYAYNVLKCTYEGWTGKVGP
ncbi:hypothetical protein PRIPAC_96488 [Pristionchus pacificus]|uniref:Uncharacterized protein n=1 Tax=Pristionchus pacificus TaxID=54126 RepID=A0A2A6D109_PRIPA|nr:hypothetical protein PRIPAC_96488 [Pristionchus pacificus]|eukprot:PDM83971.1 hypothetical protein PRIPAC_34163 [Pristionchus pacificus]